MDGSGRLQKFGNVNEANFASLDGAQIAFIEELDPSEMVGSDASGARKITVCDPSNPEHKEKLAAIKAQGSAALENIGFVMKNSADGDAAPALYLSEEAMAKHGDVTVWINAETGEERKFSQILVDDMNLYDRVVSKILFPDAQKTETKSNPNREPSRDLSDYASRVPVSSLQPGKVVVQNAKGQPVFSNALQAKLMQQLAANESVHAEEAHEKEKVAREESKLERREKLEDERELKHERQQEIPATAVDNPEPVDAQKVSTAAVDRRDDHSRSKLSVKQSNSENQKQVAKDIGLPKEQTRSVDFDREQEGLHVADEDTSSVKTRERFAPMRSLDPAARFYRKRLPGTDDSAAAA